MTESAPRQQGLYDPRFEHDACGIGFVADIRGRKSHRIVADAMRVLENLEHRGACGCEKGTGDGAGILVQMPHAFLAGACALCGFDLPPWRQYGAGLVFLPRDPCQRYYCETLFAQIAREQGQTLLGWRTVPVDDSMLGATAKRAMPCIRQVFIGRDPRLEDDMAFERQLFVIRRRVENAVRCSSHEQKETFHVPSLSFRTIVYKGMLNAPQLAAFFPDLSDPAFASALAMVHSRFSTNTFPSWARAHPYRYLCHNGEINTLRGNVNWMNARQSLFASNLLGQDLTKVLPAIDERGSDSAMLDNALELLVLAGRSLPHALMMLIPEPWVADESMSARKRDFYEYHACLMEPWDGPAALAFTDGTQIGALLDRNGLRPARYYVTTDDVVILASEVGVLDVPPEKVLHKGRLRPGRMFLVDTQQGRIIDDDEIKHQVAAEQPYGQWLRENLVELKDISQQRRDDPAPADPQETLQRQQVFGYTTEDLKLLMGPMAADGVEAIGSMGNDAALAVLSDRPQLLYNYFKQLFAQVTNPPVDAIREEIVMSMGMTLGREGNLLEPEPHSCRRIKLASPILTNHELDTLRNLGDATSGRFRSRVLPMLFPVAQQPGDSALEQALAQLCEQAGRAIEDGCEILILTDCGHDAERAPIPALLAVAAVHHHLIRQGTRTRASLVVQSGEPREVHHVALLLGYGASAVHPYLAYESLGAMVRQGLLNGATLERAVSNYARALTKGLLKIMSKMGISTVQSYCGAQVFEAVGLDRAFVARYFAGTPSRISGIGLDVIARETAQRTARAYERRQDERISLDVGGQYQFRKDGEAHLVNPQTIHRLQLACRTNNYQAFKDYSRQIDDQSQRLCTLRGLFEIKPSGPPVPIDEVEPVDAIVQRFKSGAMSYGSISKEAHETLAIAMNRLGGKSNTGEGGEDPARYVREPNGDSKNSAIKQVASARFGVTSNYLVHANELQIKMAQGAKPGEGGQLPGHKVYPWIAKVRHATPGVGLISPPPHHDIYSIEDLAELIHDLKNANDQARISVKLVAEVGVGTVAAGVAKGHADVILISGHDGGTGASPLTSIKHAGAPWELGLAETQQTLLLNNLRSRVWLEVDGQLKTGRDVVIGALLGAEEFGFATAPLVALGCVMMRVCHFNTCPVGIATQDPRLRARFAGKPEHVVGFMRFIAQEVREWMAQLGFRKLEDMVGRADLLDTNHAIAHYKAQGLDLSPIFHVPDVGADVGRFRQFPQDHELEKTLDRSTLLELCKPAIEEGKPVRAMHKIKNVHRVVGTMVGSAITRRHGPEGLRDDTITLQFQGSAGQSFGAFIPRGLTLVLEGDANDYIGKGLSGGKIIVHPPAASFFDAAENVIIGNVAFYGATAGTAFIRGIAGERFCVRNSGAHAVVLGVGDHGCEYMTGGRVVVLGPTGRNFAAGMSGGIAYVLDESGHFTRNCNTAMVELVPLDQPDEIEQVRDLVRRYTQATNCTKGRQVLALWDAMLPRFVKVYPNDYRRVLETEDRYRAEGLPEEEAVMAAFEENAHSLARAGGN